ncbi:MAG: hypothetical protein L0332_06995 [Chloroflexi bacterium]|nr:hypothetical protein [Chloroflexota bacterium]MCI0579164.1 hypothetical protein [Chloroflexota bacterium]MCI0647945.1 hypothetical protein [Chloroflexota bacterium]MCI0726455.1 hypothetical protein [Chloroflexota bacterium]
MNNTLKAVALPHLDELLATYEGLRKSSKYDDLSDLDTESATEFVTAAAAAIKRIAGSNSEYAVLLERVFAAHSPHYYPTALPHLAGILKALRHAVVSDYLVSLEEIIHASVFSDFLEMAEYLLSEGYKDPAAVLIGGVLEEHLRTLCNKNGIPVEVTDAKGTPRPKKAEAMNSELASHNVYSKSDQKIVTSWLDLRNRAAHGKYSEYTAHQVELMLHSIQDFLVRNPA